jgi:TP901 family phage tail tape measure protein
MAENYSVAIEWRLNQQNLLKGLKEAQMHTKKVIDENKKLLQTGNQVKNLFHSMGKGLGGGERQLRAMRLELDRMRTSANRVNMELKRLNSPNVQATRSLGRNTAMSGGIIGSIGDNLGALGAGFAVMNEGRKMMTREDTQGQIANINRRAFSDSDRSQAYDLANQAKQTIGDTLEAIYEGMSATLSFDESKTLALEAGKFATGANANIHDSTQTLLSMNHNYGKDYTMKQMSDILTGTMNASRGTGQEIAGAVGRFMPLAKNKDIKLDEILAVFAATTMTGIGVDESATAVGQLLTQLTKSNAAMESIGINSNLIKTKGIQGVLDVIGKETKGMNDDQFDKFITDFMPEVRGMRSLLPLINNPGQLQKTMSVVKTGSTDFNFNMNKDNTSKKLNELTNAFSELFDEVAGTGVLTMLQKATDGWIGIMGVMGKGVDQWQKWADQIGFDPIKGAEIAGSVIKQKYDNYADIVSKGTYVTLKELLGVGQIMRNRDLEAVKKRTGSNVDLKGLGDFKESALHNLVMENGKMTKEQFEASVKAVKEIEISGIELLKQDMSSLVSDIKAKIKEIQVNITQQNITNQNSKNSIGNK